MIRATLSGVNGSVVVDMNLADFEKLILVNQIITGQESGTNRDLRFRTKDVVVWWEESN